MPVSQPVSTDSRSLPVARLELELRTTGVGQLAIGVAGLVVALTARDVSPAQGLVPFVIVMALVGGLSHYATRWIRSAETPSVSPSAQVEERRLTLRRCVLGLTFALLAVAAATAVAGGLGAVLGGVVASVGAVDLLNLRWLRGREEETGRQILRELGRSPFAGGRRPLYTRPRNESTLAT